MTAPYQLGNYNKQEKRKKHLPTGVGGAERASKLNTWWVKKRGTGEVENEYEGGTMTALACDDESI
jgi:hypothetical protein